MRYRSYRKIAKPATGPAKPGPMSFLSYETTRPWAKSIKRRYLTKKMPPWFAEQHFGKFSNDRRWAKAPISRPWTAWA